MSIDTVGNFLTVIRNASKVAQRTVRVPHSNLKQEIARVLKEEGYIRDFKKEDAEGNKAYLNVVLKYVDGESSIHEIKRVSKPGRRHYAGFNNVESVIGGLGISILSTSKGIVTDQKAKTMAVGGEVLCTVW